MSTPVGAESVTAAVKPWFEDRFQNLEYGLLNPPVHHIRNTQAALAASRFRNSHSPDITPSIGSLEKRFLQLRQQSRRLIDHLLHAPPVHPGRSLVSRHVQQRLRQIARRRCCLHQPPVGGCASGSFHPAIALRCLHQESLPIGLVLRAARLVPLRAVSEHEGPVVLHSSRACARTRETACRKLSRPRAL